MSKLLYKDFDKALSISVHQHLLPGKENVKLITDSSGAPIYAAGKNSFVFKASIDGEIVACKCYTSNKYSQLNDLKKVADFINQHQFDWMIPFSVNSKPLKIIKENGTYFDSAILLMPWVEGETLELYIKTLCKDQDAAGIHKLFLSFVKFANKVHASDVSHGNITPANIMITEKGNLILINHNTFSYNEETAPLGQFGWTPAYQHPSRKISRPEIHADHFSILILAISLKALSLEPELYQIYNSSNGLLFTVADFRNIAESEIFKALSKIEDKHLQKMLYLLKVIIGNNCGEIPQLEKYLNWNDNAGATSILQMEIETLKVAHQNIENKIQEIQQGAAREQLLQEKLKTDNKRLKGDVLKHTNSVANLRKKRNWWRGVAAGVIVLSLGFFGYTFLFPGTGINNIFTSHTQEQDVKAVTQSINEANEINKKLTQLNNDTTRESIVSNILTDTAATGKMIKSTPINKAEKASYSETEKVDSAMLNSSDAALEAAVADYLGKETYNAIVKNSLDSQRLNKTERGIANSMSAEERRAIKLLAKTKTPVIKTKSSKKAKPASLTTNSSADKMFRTDGF
jgi:eukaryotic-like serine/threonine-protein kinase